MSPLFTYKPAHESIKAFIFWSFTGHILQKQKCKTAADRYMTKIERHIVKLHDNKQQSLENTQLSSHHLFGRHDGADEDTSWH